MPKPRTLAGLTPDHLDTRVASNELTSPLTRYVELEILTMINEGQWDTYPIRLTIIGANNEPSLHHRLAERLKRQRNAAKLMRYYDTFSRYSYNKAFPEFVERVARQKLSDAFTVKLVTGDHRTSPILVIDKA